MRPVLAALALALLAAPALAGTSAAVKSYVAELDKTCTEVGGTPNKSPTLLKWADLNGDGIDDTIVDVGAYDCGGAVSALSGGQSGNRVAIFTGNADGTAQKAYENTVYGITIEDGKSIRLDVGGGECGQKTADVPFSDWDFCSRPLHWDKGAKSFGFGPMSEAKRIE